MKHAVAILSFALAGVLVLAGISPTQQRELPRIVDHGFAQIQVKQMPKQGKANPVHGRGRVADPKRQQWNRVAYAAHRKAIAAVPVTTLTSFDARTKGWAPPVNDQGSCGNCYANSGTEAAASAQMLAGVVPADGKFALSVQYFMDCQNVGGCNGGDEMQVAQLIQSGGCPTMADYPGDAQGPGRCKFTSAMKLYTLSSIIPLTPDGSIPDVQTMKNFVAYYGFVSVAVAAGSDWDNYQAGGVITGHSTDVNHAVGVIGFRTNADVTVDMLMQNSWSLTWGDQGTAWVRHGADSLGTESFVCVAGSGPAPPGPVPPPTPPPTPPPPTPGSTTVTITYTPDQVTSIAQQLGLTQIPSGGVVLQPDTASLLRRDFMKAK